MKHSLAAGLILFAAVTALARKDETYSPEAGRFTVNFPGKPKETKQATKSAVGELKVYTATYATSDGNVYMVSYTDFPEGAAKPENNDTFYKGVRAGLIGKNGKVVEEKEIALGADKRPGHDIVVDRDKRRMKFRVVLHDHRLYQVAVIGSESFVKGKDAKAFIDSFELAK